LKHTEWHDDGDTAEEEEEDNPLFCPLKEGALPDADADDDDAAPEELAELAALPSAGGGRRCATGWPLLPLVLAVLVPRS